MKQKSMYLEILINLSMVDSIQKNPSIPDYARIKPSYNDSTANGLTKAIIDFIQLSGGQSERISTTGRYIDGSKVVTNHMGQVSKIGSGKYIPGSGTKGSADISATIRGKSVKIEVKMKDKQSDHQKKYQADVERAGGSYLLVRSFDEFYLKYLSL